MAEDRPLDCNAVVHWHISSGLSRPETSTVVACFLAGVEVSASYARKYHYNGDRLACQKCPLPCHNQ